MDIPLRSKQATISGETPAEPRSRNSPLLNRCYKTFFFIVETLSKQAGVFISCNLLQPSVMFAGKARSIPKKEANLSRLSCNVLQGTNTLAYLSGEAMTKKTSLITLTTIVNVLKLFYSSSTLWANEVECLSLVSLYHLV
jgi:hypothetical protein